MFILYTRCLIKTSKSLTSTQMHQGVMDKLGESAVSNGIVKLWYIDFKSGTTELNMKKLFTRWEPWSADTHKHTRTDLLRRYVQDTKYFHEKFITMAESWV